MTRLAALWDWVPPAVIPEERTVILDAFQRAASALGVALHFLEIRTIEDLDRVLTTLAGERVDALFATSGPVHAQPQASTRIVELSLARRLPTMTDMPGRFFRAGILMRLRGTLKDSRAHRRASRRRGSPRAPRVRCAAADALLQAQRVGRSTGSVRARSAVSTIARRVRTSSARGRPGSPSRLTMARPRTIRGTPTASGIWGSAEMTAVGRP
jgi:hypothetical protein